MFVEFDQRIDPMDVLGTIKVRAGSRTLKTRLATPEELAHEVSNQREQNTRLSEASKERVVAFRVIDAPSEKPDQALPADSKITVSVGPGTPSKEGTGRAVTPYDFSFRTHGPLVVTDHDCDPEPCEVYSDFSIELSNALDESNFNELNVKVEPRLEDMDVSVDEGYITIRGHKRGRTTYRVTLDPSIKDQFNHTARP